MKLILLTLALLTFTGCQTYKENKESIAKKIGCNPDKVKMLDKSKDFKKVKVECEGQKYHCAVKGKDTSCDKI